MQNILPITIRLMTVKDLEKNFFIYLFYRKQKLSLKLELPTDFKQIETELNGQLEKYPWLIALDSKGKIMAYITGQLQDPACSMQRIKLFSYVNQNYEKTGLIELLYQKMLSLLTLLNYDHAYVCISPKQTKSILMHQKMGFIYRGIVQDFEDWNFELQSIDRNNKMLKHLSAIPKEALSNEVYLI